MITNVFELIGNEKWRDLSEITIDRTVYYKNTKVRDFLNKVLDAGFKAAFTKYKTYDVSHDQLDYSGEDIYLVTSKGKIASLSNSEWAFICAVKEK